MPSYKVTAPDGKSYKVTAPEGATQEDALAHFQKNYQPQEMPSQAEPPQQETVGSTGDFSPTMHSIEGTDKNPKSSASGKGQFLDSTWLQVAKRYGGDKVKGMSDPDILKLKGVDDEFKDKMIGSYAGQIKNTLSGSLGREPTEGELYLGWQQGAGGASRLLKNPDASAFETLLPLYRKDGRTEEQARKITMDAVKNNLPKELRGKSASITSGEFAENWTSKFNTKNQSRLAGAAQSASFGLIDEQRAMGAAVGMKYRGDKRSMGEIYREQREAARSEYKKAEADNPDEFFQGEIVGGLGAGGFGVAKAGGKALLKQGLKSKAHEGGKVAGGYGAAYGFGQSEGETIGEQALDTAIGGGVGYAAGAALPMAGAGVVAPFKGMSNIVKGIGAKNADALVGLIDKHKGLKNAAYEAVDGYGGHIEAKAMSFMAKDIKKVLGELHPQADKEVIEVLNTFLSDVARGKKFTLGYFDKTRQSFAALGQKNAAAMKSVNFFDKQLDYLMPQMMSNKSPHAYEALKSARRSNVQYRKIELIANIVRDAGGDADRIKSGLQRLLKSVNDKKIRGWDKDGAEYKALKYAAHHSKAEGMLKLLGKFGVDFDELTGSKSFAPAATVAGAYLFGGGEDSGDAFTGSNVAKMVMMGTVAKQLHKYIGRGKAEKLIRMLEKGEKIPAKDLYKVPPHLRGYFDGFKSSTKTNSTSVQTRNSPDTQRTKRIEGNK